jgi:1-acyl-sn-glycerol-3-phosphate acyltransferase
MHIDKLMYWFSKPVVATYSDTMLKLDIKMEHPLIKGPKIIAANHPSTTDPFYVARMVRHQSFIMINEVLFNVPILGEYLRRSGHIPVVAGNGPAAIEASLERLAQGKTVIIFPEGDLSPEEGGFQNPRTGVARLALASGAPVVPVGIHLQRERIHSILSTVKGEQHIGRWYIRGPYNMTIGQPLYYRGDVEDRPLVRSVASSIMHNIIELSRLSEIRMNQKPTPLATLPELH